VKLFLQLGPSCTKKFFEISQHYSNLHKSALQLSQYQDFTTRKIKDQLKKAQAIQLTNAVTVIKNNYTEIFDPKSSDPVALSEFIKKIKDVAEIKKLLVSSRYPETNEHAMQLRLLSQQLEEKVKELIIERYLE